MFYDFKIGQLVPLSIHKWLSQINLQCLGLPACLRNHYEKAVLDGKAVFAKTDLSLFHHPVFVCCPSRSASMPIEYKTANRPWPSTHLVIEVIYSQSYQSLESCNS